MKLTFLQYLIETEEASDDVENLSPEELKQRSRELQKLAQIKKTNPEMAKRRELMALRKRLQQATDPRQKADIQRRIQALMKSGSSSESV